MVKFLKKIIKKLFFKYFDIKINNIEVYTFCKDEILSNNFNEKFNSKFCTIYNIAYFVLVQYWFDSITIVVNRDTSTIFLILEDINFELEKEIIGYLKDKLPANVLIKISENIVENIIGYEIKEK
jgi:hypothetical protein